MSFAIIETGGKQYKVSPSKIIEIEKLELKEGETIKFKNVLLLNDNNTTEIGNPNITGAMVEAKLIKNVKDRTILVFHKRRRKHSRKKNGHRQHHSKIQITKIFSKNGKVLAEAKTNEVKKIKVENKVEKKIKTVKKKEKTITKQDQPANEKSRIAKAKTARKLQEKEAADFKQDEKIKLKEAEERLKIKVKKADTSKKKPSVKKKPLTSKKK